MADHFGSATLAATTTISTAGQKTTFSTCSPTFVFASQVDGHTNALVLSIDTPGTLSLSVDTPGTLSI